MNRNFFFLGFIILISSPVLGQKDKVNNLIALGNEFHEKDAFNQAEAEYRKSLSLEQNNTKAHHNLGNSLYRSNDYDQASQRYFLTQKNSNLKAEKHLAFHNMGNTFMQKKEYEKAVEAYKNALRNNPSDDETRYNYALAKELLEKEQQEQENQDQQDQQDQQGDQDQNKDQDQQEGDQKEDSSKEGEEEEQDSKEEKEESKPNEPQEKEGENKQPPPRKPGQISPEQVKSLLEAMNQQEKNVQDKVNAEKVKGVPIKTKKDW